MPLLKTRTTREPAPSWVTKTPCMDFQIVAWSRDYPGGSGSGEECIDISREEYIALKLHLAKMRGYTVEEEAA